VTLPSSPIRSPSPDFVLAWRRWFPLVPPIGHRLRVEFPDRWFRIHSLPGSKRYADTEAEWTELLARHDAVATDVLGARAPCFLAVLDFGDRQGWPPSLMRFPLSQAMENPGDEFDAASTILTCSGTWSSGVYEDVIRSIADDRDPRVLWFSPKTGHVYAPYDGGADLILADARERDEYRSRYGSWLGSGPGGL
jgi:hypothetical protein